MAEMNQKKFKKDSHMYIYIYIYVIAQKKSSYHLC